MNILVVGGAGYIGSHAVRALIAAGHTVRVFDSLEFGHAQAVPEGLLTVGDLADRQALWAALTDHNIEAVMHFAAYTSVPESVSDPAKYYANNLVGSLNLLEAMRTTACRKIVFSSTAAVYGVPEIVPIVEGSPRRPINPYGVTKLAVEQALADYASAFGFGYAALRYFNACGASSDASIGEDHKPETHIIPIILQVALGQRDNVAIFGTDYPTPDGTCVRDYIHVEDLAEAHVKAIEAIEPGRGMTYNVGTGEGFSVRQVVESCKRVTGKPIAIVEKPRRPGDPPALVASSDAIRRDLGWTPRFTEIDDIVKSAWAWHSSKPDGYGR